jgi:hypothetical protein
VITDLTPCTGRQNSGPGSPQSSLSSTYPRSSTLRFGRILEIEIHVWSRLNQKSHDHPCHDLEDFRDT